MRSLFTLGLLAALTVVAMTPARSEARRHRGGCGCETAVVSPCGGSPCGGCTGCGTAGYPLAMHGAIPGPTIASPMPAPSGPTPTVAPASGTVIGSTGAPPVTGAVYTGGSPCDCTGASYVSAGYGPGYGYGYETGGRRFLRRR